MKTKNPFKGDDLAALEEVHRMCCFEKKQDSKTFWLKVTSNDNSFEEAMNIAKSILLEEGMKVFSRKKPNFLALIFKYTRAGKFRSL